MFWLQAIRWFLAQVSSLSVWTASCAFGSLFLKEFQFIGCCLNAASLHWRCRCGKGFKHRPVRGANAKASAVYCWGLSQAIARVFFEAVSQRSAKEEGFKAGLENVLVNDVLATSRSWNRKQGKGVAQMSNRVDPIETLRNGM